MSSLKCKKTQPQLRQILKHHITPQSTITNTQPALTCCVRSNTWTLTLSTVFNLMDFICGDICSFTGKIQVTWKPPYIWSSTAALSPSLAAHWTDEHSPGDELGLIAHFRLEVLPGGGHLSPVRLHYLPVSVVEATDEFQQSDGSVLVDVKPVKYPLSLGRRHLQLCTDGEEFVFLDLAGVVHVVGVEEGAEPFLLLCAHTLDGGLWPAKKKEGVLVDHRRANPELYRTVSIVLRHFKE